MYNHYSKKRKSLIIMLFGQNNTVTQAYISMPSNFERLLYPLNKIIHSNSLLTPVKLTKSFFHTNCQTHEIDRLCIFGVSICHELSNSRNR